MGQTTKPATANQVSTKTPATGQANTQQAPAVTQGNGQGNQAAIDKLAGKQPASQKPGVNLGAVQDGAGFMKAAGVALDAAVPSPGSFASIKVSGKLPIWSSGAATAYLEPALSLQVARTNEGKFEVTLSSEIGLKAEAGTGGGKWWPKFLAYFKGYVKGSMKIVGDSAAEIFRQFMLTVRMVVEGACDAAGAPGEIKSMMANGVMSGATKDATVKGMDKDDSVTVSIGGGVEAGANTSFGSASAGVDVDFSKKITNKDGNPNAVEVGSTTSVTVKGSFTLKKLGLKVDPKVTFVFAGGKLDEWFVGISASKSMKLGEFSALALMGTEWATEASLAIINLIKDAAGKSKRSELAQISSLVGGLSFGPEALKYTAFGNQLKKAATAPDFAGKSSMQITFGLSAQAGWSKSKGANAKGAINSESSWKLGDGNSPLTIEAKSGEPIVSFSK